MRKNCFVINGKQYTGDQFVEFLDFFLGFKNPEKFYRAKRDVVKFAEVLAEKGELLPSDGKFVYDRQGWIICDVESVEEETWIGKQIEYLGDELSLGFSVAVNIMEDLIEENPEKFRRSREAQ